MIWSIVISLIPIFIIVFIFFHTFDSLWTRLFSNEASEENNIGLSTSGKKGKREDIVNSSLRGYCVDFQASLNSQNQGEENETFYCNDVETPTNKKIDSQSIFNRQDEKIESRALTSVEVSSTNPIRCCANSQVESNQPGDGKKNKAVPCSDILHRNHKGINCNKSGLETIQPDEIGNESLSSRDFFNENVIGIKQMKIKSVSTNLSKNHNEIFPSEDIHCRNLKNCFSNPQLVFKKQQDEKKDLTQELPDTHIKNSKECCKVSELLSKNIGEGREDKGHTIKDVQSKVEGYLNNIKKNINEIKMKIKDNENKNLEEGCFNNAVQSKKQNDGKENKLLLSKDDQIENLKVNCTNSLSLAKQQEDKKDEQTLPHKSIHKNNNLGQEVIFGECLSSLLEGKYSPTASREQVLERNSALQLKGIQIKDLERNYPDSQLLPALQYTGKENKELSTENIQKKNVEGQLITSQTIFAPKDDGKGKALPSKNIQNKNLQGNSPNSLLQSKKQDDRTVDKSLSSKDFHTRNTEEYLNKAETVSNQKRKEMENKNLPSKDVHSNNEGYLNKAKTVSNQKREGMEDKYLPFKDVLSNNEGYLNKAKTVSNQKREGMEDKDLQFKDVHNNNNEGYLNKAEIFSNQKTDGMEYEDLPSKCAHNRSPSRYFYNSELVSKQQKEKMDRAFASKIKDCPKGVGSFMCVLFENQLYTDVTFISKGNKALLSAHRAVLAAKCEYFKDLLYGDLAKESDGMQMDLEINEVPFCIFSSIVKWFYTGNIEFSDDYTVLQVYQAAKHFRIQLLINECRSYIESMEINEQNVCSNLQLSNTLQVNELKRRCIKYIEQNTLSLINSTKFEKSPFNIVREICQLQCLSLKSEAELLEAIVRWLNAQPKLKSNAVKELERALLKGVRFLSLSTKDFSDVISKNPALMTAEESLNILLYLNNPTPDGLKALPKWCNKSQRTLLSNQERKDPGIEKKLLSNNSEVGKIKIELKPPDIAPDYSELTSVLHMRCKKGMHQITSVKFSFQASENGGCVLAHLKIIVNIMPNGPKFLKTCSIRQSEITFDFKRAVTVHEGQVLMMEVTANINQSRKFFQFNKWFNDPKSDFDCFFISKPTTEKLYFISEVAYEPLAPRLNSPF